MTKANDYRTALGSRNAVRGFALRAAGLSRVDPARHKCKRRDYERDRYE